MVALRCASLAVLVVFAFASDCDQDELDLCDYASGGGGSATECDADDLDLCDDVAGGGGGSASDDTAGGGGGSATECDADDLDLCDDAAGGGGGSASEPTPTPPTPTPPTPAPATPTPPTPTPPTPTPPTPMPPTPAPPTPTPAAATPSPPVAEPADPDAIITVQYAVEGDYDTVVGSKKTQFLEECTASLSASSAVCSDVRAGSIIVDITGKTAAANAAVQAIESSADSSLTLPTFGAMKAEGVQASGAASNTALLLYDAEFPTPAPTAAVTAAVEDADSAHSIYGTLAGTSLVIVVSSIA